MIPMGLWMKRWRAAGLVSLLVLAGLMLGACSNNNDGDDKGGSDAALASYAVDEQPSSVYYEIFVRSFYDTNGDGIGDLNGVTAKLDYLKELGVEGIWLMPINASPSYHGYDVTDYYAVNPEYGTLADLKKLLDEAHKRDMKVIMDLVVNHTSKEHPWFKEAAANADSKYRSWYHFAASDAEVKSDGAVGGDPWHSLGLGGDQYLGVFWEGMPDLNFDEPAVRAEMIKAGQYWLKQGLDGFRLDAAKHIYGDYGSTVNSPEIQAKNKQWWQEFRAGMLAAKPDAFLIGEVWDSLTVIAPYFDKGLDSAFNFDLTGKLLGAADKETDPDLAFSLGRAYGLYEKSSGGTFVDAPFLSNHDQNRVMTVLQGKAEHARMAASLLLTLPGNPFIYYGEELGMLGAKPDEYIREPMPWYKAPTGGEGQTKWELPRFNRENSETVSVEAQQKDDSSMLALYKELISWRKEEAALRDGTIAEYKLAAPNKGVSTYLRVSQKERVLVVHNLTGEQQVVEFPAASEPYGKFGKVAHSAAAGGKSAKLKKSKLTLPPYSTAILK
ncbi:alpha-amylase family glycosyl hydrolase [Paenibacillus sp. GCM10023252]|uniref:alpha-amylase family glycosyl hydrolase n=1 Tax=Paenibacillus sp. GCM10023252 TaxID=3252649 RepID=UPI0036245A78